MGGLIVAAASFAYLALSFTFARCAYRHEYNLIYGSPAPQYYGGKHGHGKAHEVAMKEACQWLVMWPIFMAWEVIEWLIAHGVRQGWVEAVNEITQLQTEVDQLAAKQDPLKKIDQEQYLDLKHGPRNDYPVIEMPARSDPWLWDDSTEIYGLLADHPEFGYLSGNDIRRYQAKHGYPVSTPDGIIRTQHPEKIIMMHPEERDQA